MSSLGEGDEAIKLDQVSHCGKFRGPANMLVKRENDSSLPGYVFAGWLSSSVIFDAIAIGLGFYGRAQCPRPCGHEDHLTSLTTASAATSLVSAGVGAICTLVLVSRTGKRQCAIRTMATAAVIKLVLLAICLSSFISSFPYLITRETMCDVSVGIAGIELVLITAVLMPEGLAEILVEILSIICCALHD
jgi:hypothetical protein